MKQFDKLYINGEWVKPNSTEIIEVINPATESPCARVPSGNRVDVNAAVASARQAFNSWAHTPAENRAAIMNAAADEMQRRTDDLIDAHVVAMGCPRHLTAALHVDAPIEGMRYYADRAKQMEAVEEKGSVSLLKEPIGVCALINPWNYPLHQLIGKVAPALAAGCTIVAKPAGQTPLQDFIMAEIFAAVGLPAGVFNLVSGSGSVIGPMMSSHPDVDMVSFTGSTDAGIKVAEAAAPTVKRVCQELGGKSPYIITEDADLEAAVRYGVEDVMLNTGQTCNALTRMFVPRSRYDEAVNIAKKIAEENIVGDPNDSSVTMGPMASASQKQTVLKYIKTGIAEGARLVTGGIEMPPGLHVGAYIRPTIFADVSNKMVIAKEEIFGPVLCMIVYEDIEVAIEMANDTVFGLASGVYARDKASAVEIARRIRAGQCYIQGGYFNLEAPFGGYKQSGNGREWGDQAMHEYIETKAIIA
ncbi:MAG: aldehyde dehydrogenase family protein [Desulfobacterales bacterium]|jgi:aldehyde dehydrogenase (NAD+)